jgi:hypothetical protein
MIVLLTTRFPFISEPLFRSGPSHLLARLHGPPGASTASPVLYRFNRCLWLYPTDINHSNFIYEGQICTHSLLGVD